jgi:hypothetical protein
LIVSLRTIEQSNFRSSFRTGKTESFVVPKCAAPLSATVAADQVCVEHPAGGTAVRAGEIGATRILIYIL